MSDIPPQCQFCALHQHNGFFCSVLNDSEINRLSAHSRPTRLKRGEPVRAAMIESWPVIGICEGIIGVRRVHPDGRGTIAAFFIDGDIVDLRGAPENMADGQSALTETAICHLSPGAFDEILSTNPDARMIAWKSLQAQSFRVIEHSAELAKKQAMEKIAWFIAEFRSLHRVDGTKGSTRFFRMPFRHVDLADYLGLQPETISRGFRSLRDRKVIRMLPDSMIEIVDPDALFAMAYGPEGARATSGQDPASLRVLKAS